MDTRRYEVRWVAKDRLAELRRKGPARDVLLLDHISGVLAIEPAGENIAGGPLLSPEEVQYEMQPAWLLGPRAKVVEARRRLGLEERQPAGAGA